MYKIRVDEYEYIQLVALVLMPVLIIWSQVYVMLYVLVYVPNYMYLYIFQYYRLKLISQGIPRVTSHRNTMPKASHLFSPLHKVFP